MWWTKEIKKGMARLKGQAQPLSRLQLWLPPMRTNGPLPADFGELCRIWEIDATDAEQLAQFVRARRREAWLFGVTGIVCAADVLWSLHGQPLWAGVILAMGGAAFLYIIAVKFWQAACVRERRYIAYRAWWLGQRER
ncbi:MAG: hypothetical protein M0Z44_06390 [Gammaproteobacteria bacterium]|nr:hypothetical protein [Gammaproteobacteria bacterium]MDA8361606.1 hypothetical protein [Gammaproteobacteria bacterium]